MITLYKGKTLLFEVYFASIARLKLCIEAEQGD